jgi:uncharacterized protein YndB with AHSA1/START domain
VTAARELVEGPLVIADISGYTAFIADTELEHSREILTELLEHVVGSLEAHLTVAQLEGDAVCFVGTAAAPDLVAWIEDAYIGFHRRLRDITSGTTCPCRACSTVHTLTIKFVAHHGVYGWHRVGRVEQLVGTPVNAVHRLLKNSVPSHEYLFATAPVLDRLAAGARERFVPHAETYDHVGEIAGGFHDLGDLRAAAEQPERGPVSEGEARASIEARFDASPDAVWWLLADAGARQAWMGVQRIDLQPGARGTLTGAEFHCNHGPGAVAVFRVLSADAPRSLTQVVSLESVPVVTTFLVEPEGSPGPDGRPGTRLVARTTWELPPEHPQNEELRTFLLGAASGWLAAMPGVLAARRDTAPADGSGPPP